MIYSIIIKELNTRFLLKIQAKEGDGNTSEDRALNDLSVALRGL